MEIGALEEEMQLNVWVLDEHLTIKRETRRFPESDAIFLMYINGNHYNYLEPDDMRTLDETKELIE